MKFNLILLFSFLLPCWLVAQGVFTASVSQTEGLVGQAIQLNFRIENARFTEFPKLQFADFDVMGPSTQTSQSYINGRAYSVESYVFMLYPRREGRFTIPAVTVKTNTNQTLVSKPITITVSKNKPQNEGEDLVLKTEVSNLNPAIGEQLLIDLRLYWRIDVQNYNIARLPEAKGLFTTPIEMLNQQRQPVMLNGKSYYTQILHRQVAFPSKSGKINIAGAMVQVGVLEQYNSGPFSSVQILPVVLNSEPVDIEVSELTNPPPYFQGTVGEYDMLAYVDKNSLSTDDAFRLFVRINGKGDIKQIFEPALLFPDSAFEVFSPKVSEEVKANGSVIGGVKTFEFVINPLQAGNFSLSPTFVFFDSQTKRYIKRDTSFNISVSQGKNLVSRSKMLKKDSTAQLQPLPPQLETSLRGREQGQFFGSWYFYLLAGLPLGLVWPLRWYQNQKIEAQQLADAVINQKNASKTAHYRLNQAQQFLSKQQSKEFYQSIIHALQLFVADKTATPIAQLSKQKIRSLLAEKNVPSELNQRFETLVQSCEMGLFAGLAPSQSLPEIQQQASQILHQLETYLS